MSLEPGKESFFGNRFIIDTGQSPVRIGLNAFDMLFKVGETQTHAHTQRVGCFMKEEERREIQLVAASFLRMKECRTNDLPWLVFSVCLFVVVVLARERIQAQDSVDKSKEISKR